MSDLSAKIIGINRHRMASDGKGVTTLVGFYGCPLRCKYCLNPQCFSKEDKFPERFVEELIGEVSVDNLYFLATDGGVTFGGGEPLLHSKFICEFREKCPKEWNICVETSLNVPKKHVEALFVHVKEWFIDVKDMNPEIYERYTGKEISQVVANLQWLASQPGASEKVVIRLPLIKDFNTEENRIQSENELRKMGFTRFDRFVYRVRTLE